MPIARSITPWALLLTLVTLSPFVGGCSLESVDKRIDRLVEARSQQLGTGAAPRVRTSQDTAAIGDDAYAEEPFTINPTAEELPFAPLPDDRDVLTRIEGFYQPDRPAQMVTLEDALRIAQTTSREYIAAEEDYILSAISLLIQRHLWSPRFFNDISLNVAGDLNDGDDQAALNVVNELRVTQLLPYGGNVEARLVSQASRQLLNVVGDQTDASTQLILNADIPLLRNAGPIAREDIIQAERNLVYAARNFERFRRSLFVSIANEYFSLVAQQQALRNQEARLFGVERLQDETAAQVDAGRRNPFEARNVEQNVLRSISTLSNARESFQLAKDRFKVRLGISIDQPIEIESAILSLSDPDVGVSEAAELALTYRLDYQNAVDQINDARRDVANARNQLLPDLDFDAQLGIGTDDSDNALPAFDIDDSDYRFGVTFGLPLDREIERLNLRSTLIGLEQEVRELSVFRDNIILDARAAVREIERARLSLNLEQAAVVQNELRVESLELRREEVSAQEILDAQDELLASRNAVDDSIRDLRSSILEFLLVTGQLRVDVTGRFMPLRGMPDPAGP
ncbi:MAG: TolC family protein [Planctomycetota bacterium]